MFDFYYNGVIYKAKYWIEVNINNFLIMSEDINKNIKFIYSQNIKQLPVTIAFLRSTSMNLSKNELYNIRKSEKEEYDLADYENANLEKIDFMSLIYIYRRINYIKSERAKKFKDKILKQVNNLIYQYEEKGRFDYSEDIVDLLNFSFNIEFYNDESEEIKNLIREFAVFIRIKIYSKLNLYDLICEKEKFQEIIKGKKTLEETGFVNINKNMLIKRFLPAIEVIIRLKEDLIMTECLNITRRALLLNPYTVTESEFKRRDKEEFKYMEDARFTYNYMYYEDIGINTDIVDEETISYNRWEYEKICSHLYISAENVFKEKNISNKVIEEAERYMLITYENNDFINYFINYISRFSKM